MSPLTYLVAFCSSLGALVAKASTAASKSMQAEMA